MDKREEAMQHARCPAPGAPGEGWVLPGAALVLEQWVAYLRGGIASEPAAPCAVDAPPGQPFTVVVERLDGARTAYDSSALSCAGREVVARYLEALAYQRADQDAAKVAGYTLQCSPPKQVTTELEPPVAQLGGLRSNGLLCLYPVFDAALPGRLVARDYRAVPLGAAQLAGVSSDLADTALAQDAAVTCDDSRWQLTLRLVTPGSHVEDEGLVELVGRCPAALRLNGYDAWWEPTPATQSLLAGLIPPA